MPEYSDKEILRLTNVATVEVLTRIQNMLSSDHVEDAKKYIAEQLSSDGVDARELDFHLYKRV